MFRSLIFKVPIFCLILLLLLVFIYKSNIQTNLAEFAFLTLHQNQVAIEILDTKSKKDYYDYYLLGRIYFIENNLALSIENYNKTIELNPTFKESYYGRGLSYGFSSPIFLNNAQEDFKIYINISEIEFKDTGKQVYGLWAGYNDLSWVYFLKSEFAESEKVARDGLIISPENPWLLNMLAVALIEQNRCDEAYPILQKAKNLASKIDIKEFGQAYSGDNKKWWPKGLNSMRQTLEDNILICASIK